MRDYVLCSQKITIFSCQTDMQQQVQKMMAKKKVLEKLQEQQIISESRDKAPNNIENSKFGIHCRFIGCNLFVMLCFLARQEAIKAV